MDMDAARGLDVGWAWVILAACTLNNVLFGVLTSSSGVLNTAIMAELQADVSTAAWVGSTLIGVFNIVGVPASALTSRTSCRGTALLGAAIASAAYIVSFFIADVVTLIAVYGAVAGLGMGLVLNPTMAVVGHYFSRLRPLAAGVCCSGGAVGMLLGGPLTQLLLESYGLNGALLVHGGLALNFVLTALLFRPSPVERLLKRRLAVSRTFQAEGLQESRSGDPENQLYVRKDEARGAELSALLSCPKTDEEVSVEEVERPLCGQSGSEMAVRTVVSSNKESQDDESAGLWQKIDLLNKVCEITGELSLKEVHKQEVTYSNVCSEPVEGSNTTSISLIQDQHQQNILHGERVCHCPSATSDNINCNHCDVCVSKIRDNNDTFLVKNADEGICLPTEEAESEAKLCQSDNFDLSADTSNHSGHCTSGRVCSSLSVDSSLNTAEKPQIILQELKTCTRDGSCSSNVDATRLAASSKTASEQIQLPDILHSAASIYSGTSTVKKSLSSLALPLSSSTLTLRAGSGLLANRALWWYMASDFLWSLGESTTVIHLVAYAESRGSSSRQAAALAMGAGPACLVSRLLIGCINKDENIGPSLLHFSTLGIMAVLTLLFPLYAHRFETQFLYSVLYGLYMGGLSSLMTPINARIAGVAAIGPAYGLECLVAGVAFLVGPPLSGCIVEASGGYDLAFIFGGVSLLLSSCCGACMWLFLPSHSPQ